MADTTISALTDSAALDGTETVPILQGGVNMRPPLSCVLTYIQSALGAPTLSAAGTTLYVAGGVA